MADALDLGSSGSSRVGSNPTPRTKQQEKLRCGSSSGVERLLAKEKAAGSNPVSRSKILYRDLETSDSYLRYYFVIGRLD